VVVDGNQHVARFMHSANSTLYFSVDGCAGEFRDQIPLDGSQEHAGGSGHIVAPMHGALLEVCVSVGDSVEAGQKLAVLEAMKMHYEIVAEVAGTVVEVQAQAGKQIAADDPMFEIDVKE
jgi:geranyl-CoA carboxylase alpha subunit